MIPVCNYDTMQYGIPQEKALSTAPNTQVRPAVAYALLLGRVLEEIRDKRFSQAKLAKATGVTQATWSRYEKGQLSIAVEELVLAANVLGTTVTEILKRTDQRSAELQSRGVKVLLQPRSQELDSGLALIGAAGLGLLLGAILSDK